MREEEVKELLHNLCLESTETSVQAEPASEDKNEVCVKEESGEDIATLIAKLEELINKLSLILGEDDSEEDVEDESEDAEDDSEEDVESEPQESYRRNRRGRVSAYEQYNRSHNYRRYRR